MLRRKLPTRIVRGVLDLGLTLADGGQSFLRSSVAVPQVGLGIVFLLWAWLTQGGDLD